MLRGALKHTAVHLNLKAIHFGSEFKEKCEKMIHIFRHRNGQTYQKTDYFFLLVLTL